MARSRTLPPLALAILLQPAALAQPVLPPDFVDETLVTALDQPIGMAFLPDGRLLFTERTTAKVRLVVNGQIAATDPALTVSDVNAAGGERGLQGIAVDPRWPEFPYLYVCYTRAGEVLALVRYTGSGDLSSPTGENLTFGSPLILIDDFLDSHSAHNGLGLRFGTDGHLLMTTGDDTDHCSAQDPSSLRGALLRLDVSALPEGPGGPVPRGLLVPADNPLSGPDSNAMLVYAYGLRNPWRFHVDPTTGAILLADVGDSSYEELNEVFAGDNFGWPHREGLLERDRPECDPPVGPFADPILAMARGTTGYTVIGTAGVYRPLPSGDASWPKVYWGNLFYTDFYSGRLRRLERSDGGWAVPAAVPGQPSADDWATGIIRATDFAVGPDGSLYWLQMTDGQGSPQSGRLHRIVYLGAPVAVPPGTFAPLALAAAPNPFRGGVELHWRLARSASVTVEIFDLRGRLVRRLHDDAGGIEGRTRWDGTDQGGRRMPAGLYLARIAGQEGLNPLRVVRLD
jgi:glucose/arabinose dehydrogenase